MEISLHDVAGGALQEKVNQAFEQVMKNMQDPNTPWKNKRKINLTLTFIQNEDRTDCTCDISVDTKLAAVKPVSTKFCTEKDVSTGEIFAQEYGPSIRGQMSFKDVEQNTEDKTVEVDGNIVDTETGEVVKDSVIDLRAAKQA